jgi:hypothetical protein
MSGMLATTELFTMLRTYVDNRRKAEPTSDAIDVLIADGETTQVIVEVSFLWIGVVRYQIRFDSFAVRDGRSFRRSPQYRNRR